MRHTSLMGKLALGGLMFLVLGPQITRGAGPSPPCSPPTRCVSHCHTQAGCANCISPCCEDVWADYCQEKQRARVWSCWFDEFCCGLVGGGNPRYYACADNGCRNEAPLPAVTPLPVPAPATAPAPPPRPAASVERLPRKLEIIPPKTTSRSSLIWIH